MTDKPTIEQNGEGVWVKPSFWTNGMFDTQYSIKGPDGTLRTATDEEVAAMRNQENHLTCVDFHRMVQIRVETDDPAINEMARRWWDELQATEIPPFRDAGPVELTHRNR